ncbi:MAG: rhomboid family intramembrane serine protease [Gammaproteobacteria bacterium]
MITITDIANALDALVLVFKQNVFFAIVMVGGLWAINGFNWFIFRGRLNVFGIYPRHPLGLIGIVCSPFLHGSFNHLFYNSIPLFLLWCLMLSLGWSVFYCATVSIVLISGGLIWLFGRSGLHVGASAVAMGYWGYLLVSAVYHPSVIALLLAGLTLYYLGSLFLNVFPTDDGVSWEGHVMGLVAGIVTVYLC